MHCQLITLFAARKVARRVMNGRHFTIREGRGIEPRRVMCVVVEPEANRVFWNHEEIMPCTGRTGIIPEEVAYEQVRIPVGGRGSWCLGCGAGRSGQHAHREGTSRGVETPLRWCDPE